MRGTVRVGGTKGSVFERRHRGRAPAGPAGIGTAERAGAMELPVQRRAGN